MIAGNGTKGISSGSRKRPATTATKTASSTEPILPRHRDVRYNPGDVGTPGDRAALNPVNPPRMGSSVTRQSDDTPRPRGETMQSNNPVFRRSEEFNSRNAYGNQTYAGNGTGHQGY